MKQKLQQLEQKQIKEGNQIMPLKLWLKDMWNTKSNMLINPERRFNLKMQPTNEPEYQDMQEVIDDVEAEEIVGLGIDFSNWDEDPFFFLQ